MMNLLTLLKASRDLWPLLDQLRFAIENRVANPRQAALLKEYELCQQEAAATANWLWASTTIFIAAWLLGLAYVAVNVDRLSFDLRYAAAFATFAQIIWMAFAERSFSVRHRLFVRQRQIEQQLGLLKSIGIYAADSGHKGIEHYRSRLESSHFDELSEYVAETRRTEHLRWGWLREWPLLPARVVQGIFAHPIVRLGRAGRSSLYALSWLTAGAWWALWWLT
jgi:hypothetical protein